MTSITPSATVTIRDGAVYGGLAVSRGAAVPYYITGLRRYTVEAIAFGLSYGHNLLKQFA